jgi:hypothetical protein
MNACATGAHPTQTSRIPLCGHELNEQTYNSAALKGIC